MHNGQQPIFIMQQGTTQEQGRVAQSNNIAAAKAVAQAVRTTLGPMGMDKMLVDEGGDVIITNDGATILREIDIEHPAAKMIIEVAKTQEQECYDGTTTAVIIAGELLKRSEDLIEQNIHPTIICRGFRKASIYLIKLLDDYVLDVDMTEIDLLEIAKTALTGKSADSFKDVIGRICVEAVLRTTKNGETDLNQIHVTKALGSSAAESEIINGIILDKERCHPGMPTTLKEANIALIDSTLGVKQTEMDANIQITDPDQIAAFLEREESQLLQHAELFKDIGANVVLCQREIDDLIKYHFTKLGILAVEKVTKSDMESIAMASGATVFNKVKDGTEAHLGYFKEVEERNISEVPMIRFLEGKHMAVTLLLRGPTTHFVDEIERAFNDSIGVVSIALKDGLVLAGGGSTYAGLSYHLTKYATEISGREGMAITAFAQALESIPRTLAENAGLDPVDEMMGLLRAHSEGKKYHGINIEEGGTIDMRDICVIEPKRVVEQALYSAVETAIMVLRIDDVISSRKQE